MSHDLTNEQLGTSTVNFEPITARVGQEFSFSVRLVCDPPCDREGEQLQLLDEDDNVISVLTLGPYDGEGGNVSEPVDLVAPLESGIANWRISVPACDVSGYHFASTIADCPVSVDAHTLNILVWDVPKTVTAGQAFRFKIGVKSSSGIAPTGWAASLTRDEEEPVLFSIGSEVWPESDGLYYVEAELIAPDDLGLHRWKASLAPVDFDLPHQVVEVGFGLHCTPEPRHLVEVKVENVDTSAPLANATVQLFPFRALTNAEGVARITVPPGKYKLLVSAKDHFQQGYSVEVNDDLHELVAMHVDREMTETDIW